MGCCTEEKRGPNCSCGAKGWCISLHLILSLLLTLVSPGRRPLFKSTFAGVFRTLRLTAIKIHSLTRHTQHLLSLIDAVRQTPQKDNIKTLDWKSKNWFLSFFSFLIYRYTVYISPVKFISAIDIYFFIKQTWTATTCKGLRCAKTFS